MRAKSPLFFIIFFCIRDKRHYKIYVERKRKEVMMKPVIRIGTSEKCAEVARNFHKEGVEISKIIWGSAWKINEKDMEKIPESDFAKAKREYLEAKIKFESVNDQISKLGGLLIEINSQYLADLENDMTIKAKRFMEYESQIFELIWSGLDRI
jgi:hypothetical protein